LAKIKACTATQSKFKTLFWNSLLKWWARKFWIIFRLRSWSMGKNFNETKRCCSWKTRKSSRI